MAKLNVRKDDTVEIIVGAKSDKHAVKGKRGKVIKVDIDKAQVMVQGLNIVKRHTRPKSAQSQGGIVEKPRMIDVSNVAVVCPTCNKSTRINNKAVEDKDGKTKYVRCCHKCGALLEVKAAKAKKKATRKPAKKAEKTAEATTTETVAQKTE